jgi:hypothetical protein
MGFRSGPWRTGSTGHLPQTRATSNTVAVAALIVLILFRLEFSACKTLLGMSRRRGEDDEIKEEEERWFDPPLLLLPNPRELARYAHKP